MDVNGENLFILINNILHKSEEPLKEPINGDEILKLAEWHNVLPLVTESCCRLGRGDLVSDMYAMHSLSMATAQAKRTRTFLKLYQKLNEAGIYPLVMKGLVCRSLYGDLCDHRPSGDEDILIKKTEMKESDRVLRESGYTPDIENVTDSLMNGIQEVTYKSGDGKLIVEVHVNPIGAESDFRVNMNSRFADVRDRERVFEEGGVQIHTFGHTDHLLFLILHALKHFAFGGLGIRQLLDILMYIEKYGGEVDRKYISDELENTKATSFFNDVLYIGKTKLGFKNTWDCEPNCPDSFMDDLLISGVFGNREQVQRTASAMVMAAVSGEKKSVIGAIFPNRRRLIDRFPELDEKPWLLPVVGVKRMVTFSRHNRTEGGTLARDSVEYGKRRIALMKKYGIISSKN